MGAIKPVFIKRTGHKLIERLGNELSTDFVRNKLVVSKWVICGKGIRNSIAGYISRQLVPRPAKKYRPKPESAKRPTRDGRSRRPRE